jgi:hypothetical protein
MVDRYALPTAAGILGQSARSISPPPHKLTGATKVLSSAANIVPEKGPAGGFYEPQELVQNGHVVSGGPVFNSIGAKIPNAPAGSFGYKINYGKPQYNTF